MKNTDQIKTGERLLGKTAIVTGAGSGLGQASAIHCAAQGAKVMCADISAKAAQETAQLIAENSGFGDASFLEADVSEETSNEVMVIKTLEAFGRVDILFANAGVPGAGSVTTTTKSEWDRVIAVVNDQIILRSDLDKELGLDPRVLELKKQPAAAAASRSTPSSTARSPSGAFREGSLDSSQHAPARVDSTLANDRIECALLGERLEGAGCQVAEPGEVAGAGSHLGREEGVRPVPEKESRGRGAVHTHSRREEASATSATTRTPSAGGCCGATLFTRCAVDRPPLSRLDEQRRGRGDVRLLHPPLDRAAPARLRPAVGLRRPQRADALARKPRARVGHRRRVAVAARVPPAPRELEGGKHVCACGRGPRRCGEGSWHSHSPATSPRRRAAGRGCGRVAQPARSAAARPSQTCRA